LVSVLSDLLQDLVDWELLLLEEDILNGGSQMEDTADLLVDAHLDGLLDQGHALDLLTDIDLEDLDLSVELVTQDSQLAGLVASSHAILRGEDDSASTVLNSPLDQLKAEGAQTTGDDVGLEWVEEDTLRWHGGQHLLRRGRRGQLLLTTVDDRSDLGRWEDDWLNELSLEARWDDGLTLDESSGWDDGLTLDESAGWDDSLDGGWDTSGGGGSLNNNLEWVADWQVGHWGSPWLLTNESALEGRQSWVWESRASDEWVDASGGGRSSGDWVDTTEVDDRAE